MSTDSPAGIVTALVSVKEQSRLNNTVSPVATALSKSGSLHVDSVVVAAAAGLMAGEPIPKIRATAAVAGPTQYITMRMPHRSARGSTREPIGRLTYRVCAGATSGQPTAAPPSVAKNFRRRM